MKKQSKYKEVVSYLKMVSSLDDFRRVVACLLSVN